MAQIDNALIETIVARVITELNGAAQPALSPVQPRDGVFEEVDDAIAAAVNAQRVWARTPLEVRGRVIEALRNAMHRHADDFARKAQAETGMGRVEDKVRKNHNAANATPGLEDLSPSAYSGDKGLVVEEYAPFGVVAAITPSTHPIPVLLNSSIIITAPGNAAVFSVHPAAKRVSAEAMHIFHQAVVGAGGPPNLISMVREPTMPAVHRLFSHPDVALIAATGGPALVEAAFKSGKKVIAAGPGNPPVLVDETACLSRAAEQIIIGASFDNNILCLAEKEVFVVDGVFEGFMSAMEKAGAVRLNRRQIQALADKVFSRGSNGHWTMSRDLVGKDASLLAQAAGRPNLSRDVRLLFGETEFEHPFVLEEQMMPFLPVVRVADARAGIAAAVRAERGYRHTAMIHSNNLDVITEYGKALDTSVLVVNGCSLAGNGPPAGEAYFSHTISSPTGEGVCTPRNFARVRRICTYKSLHAV